MKKILLTALVFVITLFNAYTQGVAEKVYIQSDCASGGIDYYFYENLTVIGVCNGCESNPLIQWGTWNIENEKVLIKLSKQWEATGVGSPSSPCGSVCVYNTYTAKYKDIDENIILDYVLFEDGYETDDCTRFEDFFNKNNDVQQFLRTKFKGNYSMSSERILKEKDIKGLSKYQLKIMRNEIFARYGYKFKSKEMSDYFNKQKGYYGNMENVDAFLSDIEKKNIAFLKMMES